MHRCERCGAKEAREVSGRSARIEWLKTSYQAASDDRKPGIAERIMDGYQESDRFLCEPCTTCSVCYLVDSGLTECAICKAPACANCSLPALRVDANGRIIEGSDDGSVLCSRCNPPSGGRNAGLGMPKPVQPLRVG